ncbi:MAG: hypothetical protein CFE21_06615 [Bacteroidetes bacterium B1(2017)]|nr:MAG: hypothetical protein CFE21_06615 [Bacteroidetes bacterium B1(2017)]
MISIFIIGTGRLAHNLVNAFQKSTVTLEGVFARNESEAQAFSKKFEIPHIKNYSSIPPNCDLYFLCVSDQAIGEVSNNLKVTGCVVHCSGTSSIETLSPHAHTGVFWPIQSFSKDKLVSFKDIPICIEANTDEDKRLLEVISDSITTKTILAQGQQRQQLHLAAVLVNNFTNHLFTLAQSFLNQNQLSFDVLKPLINETLTKVNTQNPSLIQTGPAARKDFITIDNHRRLLLENPNLANVYEVLTKSILNS